MSEQSSKSSGQPSKKQRVADPDELPPSVYVDLENVQEQIEKLDEECSEEILQVERRFNEKRKPLYHQRNDVIKKIPSFWKQAFLNHSVLVDLLSEEDIKIFEHLEELNVDVFPDIKAGYKLSFKFGSNPFFKNQVLSKELRWSEDGTFSVVPTKINWKSGFGNSDQSFLSNWLMSEEEEDEVAELIKEDLWANPAKYFHGLVASDEENDDSNKEEDE